MELTPDRRISSRRARSPNRSLTMRWQSSKSPSIANAWTLGLPTVVICRRWTSDTRPRGKRMNTSTWDWSANASIAAAPVSPEVAPTIVARAPRCRSTRFIAWPSHCMAKSLNASVGPWKSSSANRLSSICTMGAVAACLKPVYAATVRASISPEPKSPPMKGVMTRTAASAYGNPLRDRIASGRHWGNESGT